MSKTAPKGSNSSLGWFLRNVGASLLYTFSRSKPEEPKIIVNRSLLIALLRCSIHLIPIGVTAYLAFLNIYGYFIGDQLLGGIGTSARNLLLIQIAAKTMVSNAPENDLSDVVKELFVVASLTSVVVNYIRRRALQKDGVPFGLLSAGYQFSSLAFLWSPAYVMGSLATKSWSKKFTTALFLAICGLLAAIAGPSTALLMIPTRRAAWFAGGTEFWLIGDINTLWPDRLTSSHVGGDMCLNPTAKNLSDSRLDMSGCVWNGYSVMAGGLKNRHFDWQSNITINDGVIKRQFTRAQFIALATESWVLGTHVASARISRLLADEWRTAITEASLTQGKGRYASLKNATAGSGIALVDSWLPVTRVACANYLDLGKDLGFNLGFYQLQEFGPVDVGNYSNQVVIGVDLIGSTQISTQWIDIPPKSAENHLTAAMVVRIPYRSNGSDNAAAFACSIDARWAKGSNIGTGLPETDNMVVHGGLKMTRDPSTNTSRLDGSYRSYLPAKGDDWRFVSVDPIWLSTLFPQVSNITGYTTLADAFTQAAFDNSTGIVQSKFSTLGATIETTIATWFVDGMSRIGLSENGGNMVAVMPYRYGWLKFLSEKANDQAEYFNRILRGETVVVPPSGVVTKMKWTVTVSGLAYSADSIAVWVALGVLFTHTLIAGFHVLFLITKRESSDSWESLEELLMLAMQSQPSTSKRVENTSAGIWKGGTMQLKTRIVVKDNAKGEIVQVIVDPQDESRVSLVQPDVAYGAYEAHSQDVSYRRAINRQESDEHVQLVSMVPDKTIQSEFRIKRKEVPARYSYADIR